MVFGKYRDIKNPDYYKDIDIVKDFKKKESIVELVYENSNGKEYTVSHIITKSGN